MTDLPTREEAEWYRNATDGEIDAALQSVFVDGFKRGKSKLIIDYELAAVCQWTQERYGCFYDARTEERDEYRRRAKAIVDAAVKEDNDGE